jgi:hypothetical protein
LAAFYNWCLEQTRFSHVCKWDGDMIALPALASARRLAADHDVVMFDGVDAVGAHTTDNEARIFRFDPAHSRYEDWDLYEVLRHDFTRIGHVAEKCYVHMKLVKREWVHRPWSSPNDLATSAFPAPGGSSHGGVLPRVRRALRRLAAPRRD